MSNTAMLCVFEGMGLGSAAFGIYIVALSTHGTLSIIYNGLWFLLSGIAAILGGFVLYYESDDKFYEEANRYLHYHYVACWLTVVLGFPPLVASVYLACYPSEMWIHAIAATSLIPFLIRYIHPPLIPALTQIMVTGLIGALTWISYVSHNWEAMAGSAVMLLNLIALSIPTKYQVLTISAHELFIAGMGVASLLFAQMIEKLGKTSCSPQQ